MLNLILISLAFGLQKQRSTLDWEAVPTNNYNPWDPNSRYTFSSSLVAAGCTGISYMARNIPAFDLASYLTEVVGNLSPPAETSIPNIPVDLYDFLDALIHEFKLLKDMIPEIDPQRILHNNIDFVYDLQSFNMWIRNIDWNLELTRDNCATGHALAEFVVRLMVENGPWFPVYLNAVITELLSLMKANFEYAGFERHQYDPDVLTHEFCMDINEFQLLNYNFISPLADHKSEAVMRDFYERLIDGYLAHWPN